MLSKKNYEDPKILLATYRIRASKYPSKVVECSREERREKATGFAFSTRAWRSMTTSSILLLFLCGCFLCRSSYCSFTKSRWQRKLLQGLLISGSLNLPMPAFSQEMSPNALIQTGMINFQKGELQSSLDMFDKAYALKPGILPYLWQRGLTQYYLNQFDECSTQFRLDLKVRLSVYLPYPYHTALIHSPTVPHTHL